MTIDTVNFKATPNVFSAGWDIEGTELQMQNIYRFYRSSLEGSVISSKPGLSSIAP